MADHSLRTIARRLLLFQFLPQFCQQGVVRLQFGGASLFVCGLISITAPLWASADHLLDGYNLVNVLQPPLNAGGCDGDREGAVDGGVVVTAS
jgi:hypothetical protein